MTSRSKSPIGEEKEELLAVVVPPGKLKSLIVMLVVGASFTVAVLVMLGQFTQPGNDAAASATVDEPFVAGELVPPSNPQVDEETCQVMSTTIKDINARMSEGVTEQQARYFRSRRNKLYQMMRERCGV